jgi:UDP-2-acetamido-2,6-beta-L-arabino-hexul-4-ose reductase
MRILVTGAAGFIGKTLMIRLAEIPGLHPVPWTRDDSDADLPGVLAQVDAVVHLAGVNRPTDPSAFQAGNVGVTARLARCLLAQGRALPVILASSAQAGNDTPYGVSKRQAEQELRAYAQQAGAKVYVFRLPNVFGKWARPNYNSAVATFAHNLANGLPITIHDRDAALHLAYVDDVADTFIGILREQPPAPDFCDVPVYRTTVGQLADMLERFSRSRVELRIDAVGAGLPRALYATYVSYLPPARFSYGVPRHADARGEFVEMLKTGDSGQFSYFTAAPGVTRGGHYHHTKTEKFLVVRGSARFRFRHIATGQRHEIHAEGGQPLIVETVPGWTHDITNVGQRELVVMLWANEVFDRQRPDTIPSPV